MLPARRAGRRRGLVAVVCLAVLAGACERGEQAVLGPPPGIEAVTVRGHLEVEPTPDGGLTAVAIGVDEAIGLCVETEPWVDTSQWRALLRFSGRPATAAGAAAPSARMATTLCFDAPPPAAAAGDGELCAQLTDTFDGRTYELPCRPLRFSPDDGRRAALVARMRSLLASQPAPTVGELVASLDALAASAVAEGFPLLALRLELVAVYFLRRDGAAQSLEAAARRLASPPPWLERPEAAAWAAQWEQNRAALELAEGRLRGAWEALRRADDAYLRIAHPNRFTVVMQRAEILGRVGAARDGARRLRAALADCDHSPCADRLVAPARGTLAWLVLLDPLASPDELAQAERTVEAALAAIDAADEPLEHSNQLVNLAYLRLRRGEDPSAPLAAAGGLLAPLGAGARRDQLDDWRRLIAAEAHLRAGRPSQAAGLCQRLAQRGATPRLSAWALSCLGRARRLVGDREGAAEALESALLLHENVTPGGMGQSIALGPGRRAEDYYAAARLAVERGEPRQAWDLLTRLDRLTRDEEALGRCREAGGAIVPPEVERRRDDLLGQLAALELPASGARREQREPIRRQLLGELQELARQVGDCPSPGDSGDDRDLDYRAVALDDEILLLAQAADGTVRVERRTPLPRRELVETVAAVERSLTGEAIDDASWRRLLASAGAALAPASRVTRPAGEPLTYSLHGVLQGLPLAALPLPAGSGASWLGELGVVALRPAAAVAARASGDTAVFVVDPRGNLPSGSRLAAYYRELFPEAVVRVGARATRDAVRSALPAARRLHFDTHGVYDAAFPELSRLELADAAVDLGEIATWDARLELANLSGCETGRWPTTADGGRFGLGGLLCRRGTAWVIASRAPLPDRLAESFNRSFYALLATGHSVPAAYGEALAELRRQSDASRWGALLLLSAAPAGDGPGEQNASAATPPGVKVGEGGPR